MTMKIKLLSLAFIFSFVVQAQDTKGTCGAVKRKLNGLVKSNSLSLSQIAETERYDVGYYFLNLNMNNSSTAVAGSAEIHAKASVALDSALFELFSSLTISSIDLDGVPTVFNRNSNVVKVPVNKMAGEQFVLTINYSGTPPNSTANPLGGNGMTNDNSPSWGNVVTWSLSEPFGAYEWFPCKQSLKDKADSCAVWVTVPTNCKAGSNGVLEQVVDLGNGTQRFEWKHRHPIDYYLISVAVANYVEYNLYAHPSNSDSVLIQNYIYNNPGTLPYFKNDIDETADFIELYADMFGPYPFANEKYGHCMAPISGGMEHQTMTTQGFFDNTLTSHELAHQWFGDHVTCNSWSHIWVNEGFASYAEDLMLEHLYPQDRAQYMLDRHSNIKQQAGGSVWVEDSLSDASIFDSRLVYDKGAAIIHTLRYLIDDDTIFFNTLKAIQIQFEDSVASAMDYINLFETMSGKNFTNFAQEWYFGEGYPTYSVRYNSVGSDFLVEINQSTSKPSTTPLFTNDIDLKVDRVSLPDTVIRFQISANQQQFIIPNASDYLAVTAIDPNNWIINTNGSITQDPNFTTVGLISENFSPALELFPNPSSGLLTLRVNSGGTNHYTVLDMQGKVLQSGNFSGVTQLNLSSLKSGSYLIQISNTEQNTKFTRVVTRF